VIARPGPRLPPDEVARRVAEGAEPIWLSSPGAPGTEAERASIAFDVFAADPGRVVRGRSVDELEAAWRDARGRWAMGVGAPPALPVGVGWLTYDLARAWLPLPSQAADDHGWAALEFRFFDAICVREVATGTSRILACDEGAADRLAALMDRPAARRAPPAVGALAAETDRASHEASVERIKRYLHAGDAYQVNLARRLSATVAAGDPLWLAASLRAQAPAAHAIWLGARAAPGAALYRYVVGNSPERFLSVDPSGRVETRPIKGTRPRHEEPARDQALRAELVAARKDRAEHVMIVDLERNDLGRVCETGSVVVEELMRVVSLPTVFHLVSTVRGQLRRGIGLVELLRATFPGGSVTGAPKRRAMEIIEEIEPVRRGIYTGATGWLGAAGDLDLAVAIRTATVAAGRLSLSVGGGIIADSDPAAEWEETEVKARAFRSALGAA